MARIGTKRVAAVLDYMRDIKGKRLIRLTAGVCSGKNYWLAEIAKNNPDLRILVITSRKNTVTAQAKKMNAGKFLDLDRLIDDECCSLAGEALTRVVCTNASIEKFFKKRFDADDEHTYLWRKFDLVVLDEAHSLTTDATFTDAFYTEWFIKHTVINNPACDVVVMSGTQEPIDWLFKGNVDKYVHEIDCFNECIHLEPDYVYMMPMAIVPFKMYQLWKQGGRMVYFANHRAHIAHLTTELMERGVPAEAFGYSFNNPLEVAGKFPKEIGSTLSDNVSRINDDLTTVEHVSCEVKILFSTSKNKEGISILDDDIKTVFAETHNKSELKQIAGRVRGNPDNGTGIEKLVIITDAIQHNMDYNELENIICRNVIDGLNKSLEDYRPYCDTMKNRTELEDVLSSIYGKFRYIRYDYVSQTFRHYKGRIHGEKQHTHDCTEFDNIIENYDLPAFSYNRTGRDVLSEEWFPWSKLLLYNTSDKLKETARAMLYDYLVENHMLNTVIKKKEREAIGDKVRELANIYGYANLGIKVDFKTVGKAIAKFGFKIEEVSSGASYRIIDLRETEK